MIFLSLCAFLLVSFSILSNALDLRTQMWNDIVLVPTLDLDNAFLWSLGLLKSHDLKDDMCEYVCIHKGVRIRSNYTIPYNSCFIDENNNRDLKRDEFLWCYRAIIFEIQVVTMRILNDLDPPFAKYNHAILGNQTRYYTYPNGYTVNCNNPLYSVENLDGIYNINNTYLKSSKIYTSQYHLLLRTHMACQNTMQSILEETRKSKENDQQNKEWLLKMWTTNATIVISVCTLVTTIIVGFCNYRYNSRKTEWEIQKIRTELRAKGTLIQASEKDSLLPESPVTLYGPINEPQQKTLEETKKQDKIDL